MSLQPELDDFKKSFQEIAPAEAVQIMARSTQELAQSGILDTVAKQGDKIPDFSLNNQDGATVNLTGLLSSGPVVINVFRGVWCPYCSIELKALNRILPELAKRDVTLVGIAPQLQESAWKNKRDLDLEFDILVDQGNKFSQQLGLCYTLPSELRRIYRNFGIHLPKYNGDNSWRLPMPARLVVNRDFRLDYADVSPDYTIRPEPERLLEILDSKK